MKRIFEYKDKEVKINVRTENGWETNISDDIVIKEMFEMNVYQVNEDLCKDAVVVDIGANIGAFCIQCGLLGAKSIFGFEPEPDNYGYLVENIKDNGLQSISHLYNSGIWNEYISKNIYVGQGATIIDELVNDKKALKVCKKDLFKADFMSVHKLFDIVNSDIDILKIDCEWAEYKIIEAMDLEMLMKVKYITMEFHSADDITFGKMIAKLSKVFNLHIIGKSDKGGQIYGDRY